jgi:diguanylate cyclase (GGDEF)-like protein
MMPGLDGLELCRKLRGRRDQIPYLYTILLTGRTAREDRLAAFRAGVDDFLVKPIDLAELSARLEVARRIVTIQEQLRNRSTELERLHVDLEQRIIHLADVASCDGLTGLKNHRYFRESLEAQFLLARRSASPLSVMMVDVDSFKAYNDVFGHPAGDDVLREVSRILRDNVRERGFVARYGGEEFAALLPSTDVEASRLIGQRLRKAVEDHAWPLRPITISLGIATMNQQPTRASTLLEQADRSLYQSKAEGRNRVIHANDLPADFADRRRSGSLPECPGFASPMSSESL